MTFPIRASAVFLAAIGAAFAQPVIRPNSVVNAASYLPPGLPNHGIAQGGMFILKGTGLGPLGTAVANSFPLKTNMGGTSMKISVGGSTVDALMIYVVVGQVGDRFGPFDQLAGIVPSTTPAGTGTITVTFNGLTSAPVPITVVPNAFGIFTINQGGSGPGIFTNPNYSVTTLTGATHPGDPLFIWGTGLGAITASDADAPPVGDLNVPVEVYVGNVRAAVSYKGRSGCCAGIDQILFTVPSGVQGCYVSVVVKVRDVVSNSVTLPVTTSGSMCSDATGLTAEALQKEQAAGGVMTIADIGLRRFTGGFSLPNVGSVQGSVDFAEGRFLRYRPGNLGACLRGSVGGFDRGRPSAGCIVSPYTPRAEFLENANPNLPDPLLYERMNAGAALNLTSPAGTRQIPREVTGESGFEYETDGPLGGGLPPLAPLTPEFLVPGRITVDNGSGSDDVGPFSASLTIPDNTFQWTNSSAFSTIPRSQELTINWSGATSGLVVIEGASANPSTQAGAAFSCVAPASAGTFRIPPWVVGAMPASGQATDIAAPIGFLSAGLTLAAPTQFQARGLDLGYLNWIVLHIKNVNYQ